MTNTAAKISIIIPCYNSEAFLHRCLDSLVNQTLADIEILAIDNNSDDSTFEIIQTYAKKHSNKVVALQQPQPGVSNARNLGLSHMTGRFVMFVDSDDALELDACEKLYNEMDTHNYDMLWFGFSNIKESTGEKIDLPITQIPQPTNIFRDPELIWRITPYICNKIFCSKYFVAKGIINDPTLAYGEDCATMLEYMFYATNIFYFDECLYLRYMREGSVSATVSENVLSHAAAFDKVAQFYKEKGYFNHFSHVLLRRVIKEYKWKVMTFFTLTTQEEKSRAKQYIENFIEVFETHWANNWQHHLKYYGTRGNHLLASENTYLIKRNRLFFLIDVPPQLSRNLLRLYRTRSKFFATKQRITKKLTYAQGVYQQLKNTQQVYHAYRDKLDIVDNRVFIASGTGFSDGLSDNTFYLLKDILRRGTYQIFVSSANPTADLTILNKCENAHLATLVKQNSEAYHQAMVSAKYLITAAQLPFYFIKHPDQVLLNTWHGTPLKKMGIGIYTHQNHFLQADYLLYPNEYTRNIMLENYGLRRLYQNKLIVTGYPRNSVLFDTSNKKKIRFEQGLLDKKVYVYMPTWRSHKNYSNEIARHLLELDKLLGDEVIIYAKLHGISTKIKQRYKHIRPLPAHYETYEFLSVVDGLITDYSSVLFDYALTGGDIVLFTYDLERYTERNGFGMDIDLLPFDRCDDAEKLALRLSTPPVKDYASFVAEFGPYDSLMAAQETNDVFLEKKTLLNGYIEDFDINKNQVYTAILMPKISSVEQRETLYLTLLDVFKGVDSIPLCCFYKSIANRHSQQLIKDLRDHGIDSIAVQTTVIEKLQLMLFKRYKFFKRTAKVVANREVTRLFPYMSVQQYINLGTEDALLHTIYEMSK